MSAQHKRRGRTARRRRQERALERLQNQTFPDWNEVDVLVKRTSQPLLPVPAKQARRPSR